MLREKAMHTSSNATTTWCLYLCYWAQQLSQDVPALHFCGAGCLRLTWGIKDYVLISLTTSMTAGSSESITGRNWASRLSARDLAFLESERASTPGVTAGLWRSGDPHHPSSHLPQWLVLRIKSFQRVAPLVVEVVNGLANCRKTRLHVWVTSLSTSAHITPPSVPSVRVIDGGMSRHSLLES
jgi:hypothetical protein